MQIWRAIFVALIFLNMTPPRHARKLNSTPKFCATVQHLANQFMHRQAAAAARIMIMCHAYICDSDCEPASLVYF